MATPNDVLVGAYNGFWGGMYIGQVGLGGYKIRQTYSRRDINFDSVGMVPVDTLFMGVNMFIDFVVMQYNQTAIKAMTWPWDKGNTSRGVAPAGGAAMFDFAEPLVLSACNENLNPKCITFFKTILAPDYELVTNLSGVEERMLPMRLMAFPVNLGQSPSDPVTRPEGCSPVVYFTETYPTFLGDYEEGPKICGGSAETTPSNWTWRPSAPEPSE